METAFQNNSWLTPITLHLVSVLPVEPEIPSRKEAGHGMTTHMVDPALQYQLLHTRIDPWEAGLSLDHIRKSMIPYVTYMYNSKDKLI